VLETDSLAVLESRSCRPALAEARNCGGHPGSTAYWWEVVRCCHLKYRWTAYSQHHWIVCIWVQVRLDNFRVSGTN